MAIKTLSLGAAPVPMVLASSTALAAIQLHLRPTRRPIGPQTKLEHPVSRMTPAFVKLIVDAEVLRSDAISSTTEKRDVEPKVAVRAVKERVKTMRHFRQRGSEKYGDGRVDVRVRCNFSAVRGVGHIEESRVPLSDE